MDSYINQIIARARQSVIDQICDRYKIMELDLAFETRSSCEDDVYLLRPNGDRQLLGRVRMYWGMELSTVHCNTIRIRFEFTAIRHHQHLHHG